MRRRRVLQLGLGGIAALGVLPRIGAQRAMAADGHETFVYVSNAGTKDIYVLGMNRETGELTMVEKVPVYPIDARYIVEDKATQIIDTKPKAHCVFIDASNKHVYVPVLGADYVMQFKFDDSTGMLTPNYPPTVATKAGAGPRHFTSHPNGKWGYLITETTATMGTYSID